MDMLLPAFQSLPNNDEKVNRVHLDQKIPDNSHSTVTKDDSTLPAHRAIQRTGVSGVNIIIGSGLKNLDWNSTS
jgi:hypothetical protein